MIQLTRLNNAPLAVNSDLIKYVEEAPDTVLTLIHGEKLVVRETMVQVIDRIREFRRSLLQGIADLPRAACMHPSLNLASPSVEIEETDGG